MSADRRSQHCKLPHVDDLLGISSRLGPDTAVRTRISYEIMSKAFNTSRLVRVARTIVRCGKSFITHLWVRESDVRKDDVVLRYPDNPKERGSRKRAFARSKGERPSRVARPKKIRSSGSDGINALTDPAWDGHASRKQRWGTAAGANEPSTTERFEVPGISRQYRKVLENRFAKGTKLARTVYDMYIPMGGPPTATVHAGGSYKPRTNEISIDQTLDARGRKGEGSGTSWFHECGHYIDFNYITDPAAYCETTGKRPPQVSNQPRFVEALKQDVRKYESRVAEQLDRDIEKARAAIGDYLVSCIGGLSNGVQDIFGGVLGEPYPTENERTAFTHLKEYWSDARNLPAEAFAHMFEAEFDPRKRALMEEFFPTAHLEFIRILEDLITC